MKIKCDFDRDENIIFPGEKPGFYVHSFTSQGLAGSKPALQGIFWRFSACRPAKVNVGEHLFYIVIIYFVCFVEAVKIGRVLSSLSEHLSSLLMLFTTKGTKSTKEVVL